MASTNEEQIVMTPKKKTKNSTTLKMERKIVLQDGNGGKVHIGGGSNAGIVVNQHQERQGRNFRKGRKGDPEVPAHLCLDFRVFLVNVNTKKFTQEKRRISYWFKDEFPENQRAFAAQEFFKKLVSPVDFPRDYVGFIKKIMKLMQKDYPMIAVVEVELTQEKEMDKLPNRPTLDAEEEEKKAEVTTERVLEAIEEAYPNSLTIDDMSRRFKVSQDLVRNMVMELVTRSLVKAVGVGGSPSGVDACAGAFRRVHQNEDNVTVVRQMPQVERAMQPTIAVITAQYHEKMAVDAALQNKKTFIRYATVGEANVYTMGDLGGHRVVTTKLPMTGGDGTRDAALIATGSSTTRLLGTFQSVEHVFMVGVGGAVPHYTDFNRHVRLGDVVVSGPPRADDGVSAGQQQKLIYQYCENVTFYPDGDGVKFETKSWCPPEMGLQEIAANLISKYESNPSEAPWIRHFESSLKQLELEVSSDASGWRRPSSELDRLYMSVGGGDVIEVGHPTPRPGKEDPRTYGEPMIHLGPIAAGKQVSNDAQLRQEFSSRYGVAAFDQADLAAVVESIYGNRKDQYMLIRGMTDYRDGTKEREWQQYSSLMAAAVLRAIVEEMEPPPPQQ